MSADARHCVIVTEPKTVALADTRRRRRWLLAGAALLTALAGTLAGIVAYNSGDDAQRPPGDRMVPWIWTSDNPDATAAPAAGGAADSPTPTRPAATLPANPEPTRRTPGSTPTQVVQQPSPSPSKASPRPRSPPPLTPPPT
jgi:hypothetical protein